MVDSPATTAANMQGRINGTLLVEECLRLSSTNRAVEKQTCAYFIIEPAIFFEVVSTNVSHLYVNFPCTRQHPTPMLCTNIFRHPMPEASNHNSNEEPHPANLHGLHSQQVHHQASQT